MRIGNIFILLFLLAAFTIGVGLQEEERSLIDGSLNNVTIAINNITLSSSIPEESNIPNLKGFYVVLEKYIKFIGSLAIEVFRAGVYFGQDNPDYFEPDTIILVMKWIVWLVIISLLIKPISYLVIIIVLIIMWVSEKVSLKKKRRGK